MKRILPAALWIALVQALQAAEPPAGEVIWLEKIGERPLPLLVLQTTRLSPSPNPRQALWTLRAGQTVRLLAWHAQFYYVEAHLSTGLARGWAEAGALEQVAESTAKIWRRRALLAEEKQALIAARKVGVGFTADEVVAAIGRPERTQRAVTAHGPQEEWHYTIYGRVPHYEYYIAADGRTVITRFWHQTVPIGSRAVIFQQRRVCAYREETPKVDLSPRPIFLGYQR